MSIFDESPAPTPTHDNRCFSCAGDRCTDAYHVYRRLAGARATGMSSAFVHAGSLGQSLLLVSDLILQQINAPPARPGGGLRPPHPRFRSAASAASDPPDPPADPPPTSRRPPRPTPEKYDFSYYLHISHIICIFLILFSYFSYYFQYFS